MKVRHRAMPLPEYKGHGTKGSVALTPEHGHQPKMRGVSQEIERDEKTGAIKNNPRPVLFPRSIWRSLNG